MACSSGEAHFYFLVASSRPKQPPVISSSLSLRDTLPRTKCLARQEGARVAVCVSETFMRKRKEGGDKERIKGRCRRLLAPVVAGLLVSIYRKRRRHFAQPPTALGSPALLFLSVLSQETFVQQELWLDFCLLGFPSLPAFLC